jgi:hypothetical protein
METSLPGLRSAGLINPADPDFSASGPGIGAGDGDELALLRLECSELREKVAELEQLAYDARKTAETLAEQQRDNEKILEEKSEVIRNLHTKIQALESRPPTEVPEEQELLALSEELERERKQLREDEETLMQQMREMEIQMARERAELARQRNDLQRLHNEIQHELEVASRQAELRDRLQPFQRKHQELVRRKGAEPDRAAPAPEAESASGAEPVRGRDSGFLRRLFG